MTIHELETCTSTNDLALESRDGQNGDTWISLEQTKGRGRRHGQDRKSWFSPANSGVYFSILLRPRCEPAKISGLTLLVGASVCDALSDYHIDAWLKWPNDIFVGTRKLAGILTEASTVDGLLDRVVVGIGINVNLDIDDVPAELKATLTSLSMQSESEFDRIEVAKKVRRKVLEHTSAFLDEGLQAQFEYISQFDRSHGINIQTSDGSGTAIGITPKGHLEIENQTGRFEVNAGEVVFLFDSQTAHSK